GKDRPATAMPRPDNGLPEDIREHMRLMTEIISLAFQTNKTRVATLLLCRDISGLFYPFLDVPCLMFINSMWSGSQHDSSKVPLLLVGGLNGQLETGRVLDFKEKGDDNRKLCSLYLSLMDKMGVKQERFGDAEGKLAGF